GTWIRGRGWDQNDWAQHDFPDHAELSRAVPDHPVFLRRVDGHAAIANAKALAIAGVDRGTADPTRGGVVRGADGTPTGVLVDGAMDLVTRSMPPISDDELRGDLEAAMQTCIAAGLTGVHDAAMGAREVGAMRTLLEAGRLPLRVYAMW